MAPQAQEKDASKEVQRVIQEKEIEVGVSRGKNISWGIGLSMKYYWNTENVTTGETGESHFPYSTLRGAVRGVRRYIKGEGGGPWIYSIFDRPYWSEDLPGPVGFTSEPVRSGIEDFR